MSEKQLHEQAFRPKSGVSFAVRPCEVEARSVSQHRMEMKLLAGCLTWVSEHARATPYFRSWSSSIEDGSGGIFLNLKTLT